MRLKDLRVGTKMVLIVVTTLIGMMVAFGLMLGDLKSQMVNDRKVKVRSFVEEAVALVDHYHSEALAGRMTDSDAKIAALAVLRIMRDSDGDYFWVNDMTPKMVMHPTAPQLEGKPIGEMKTPDDQPLFLQMVSLIQDHGSGYYQYFWPKPGFTAPVPKVSYVQGFAPWGWIIGTGVYLDDVNSAFLSSATSLGAVVLLVMLLSVAVAVIVARQLTLPLAHISDVMLLLVQGNTDVVVPDSDRKDELGKIAQAVVVFKDNLIRMTEMAERQRLDQELKEAQRLKINSYISEFKENIRNVLDGVSGAEAVMQKASVEMGSGARETKDRSVTVALAADNSASNAAMVASATEQLSASIREISGQVQLTSTTTGRAVHLVNEATDKIRLLESSVSQIGDFANLINDIASQTNLLALNATIEAARAGDAGKGFAVVANEVKHLATQTAHATDEIAQQINRVQESTKETVAVIYNISNVISEVCETTNAVSAAVEQQGSATMAIARNAEESATGSSHVTVNIHQVMDAADNALSIAEAMESSSGHLSVQASLLRQNVDLFLQRVQSVDHDAA